MIIVESSAGGTGRHVLDLAEGLVERGFDIHLIYSSVRADRKFLDRLVRIKGITHRAIAMRTGIHLNDLAAIRKVRTYLKTHGPFDIIHGHSSKGGAIARIASVGTGVAAFYTLHGFIGMDPSFPRLKRRFYLGVEVFLSWLSARIVAVSPEEGRASVKHGLGRNRVVVVPNGIPPLPFVSRMRARASIGVGDSTVVIGFVGRLVSQKAPEVLIKAFAEASPAMAGARLAMVGSGPLGPSLRELAKRLKINDRVIWLGERDACEMLPGFDFFALPSLKEGLPYVALEAMAAGLPIVATDASGVEILVEPGRNGIVIPSGDVKALAEALIKLANNSTMRERYGKSSHDRSSSFTLDIMVDQTIEAYRTCHSKRSLLKNWRQNSTRSQPSISALVRRNLGDRHSSPPEEKPMTMPISKTGTVKPRSAELHPGPGFRINAKVESVDPSLIDRFRDFDTPDISDLLNRLYAVDPGIHCLTGPDHSICGPACTVKVFPGDNLMVHKSLDIARPGDVVVVDAGGARTNAVLGDLISAKAKHRKIQGFLVDGLVRDLPAIEELDFPVYARGTTPIGPLHRGPGEINFPVCCGGIVVNPGDLIVGDAAGVIVVPREIAADLIERLETHRASNKAYFEAVRRGEFSNQWVDVVLQNQGYIVPEAIEPAKILSEPVDVSAMVNDSWESSSTTANP